MAVAVLLVLVVCLLKGATSQLLFASVKTAWAPYVYVFKMQTSCCTIASTWLPIEWQTDWVISCILGLSNDEQGLHLM